jgi:uncharacterized protein YhfF
VLAGKKTATAGVWRVDYEPDQEEIEKVGERRVVLDSLEQPTAIIEVTRVESHPFLEVPWELAQDEGEGWDSIEDFRSGHRRYFEAMGVTLADSDLMVCVWFKVVEQL